MDGLAGEKQWQLRSGISVECKNADTITLVTTSMRVVLASFVD